MFGKSRGVKHNTKVKLVIGVSLIFSFFIGTYLFNSALKGATQALDSVLLFVSISIGFLGASLSIFATVSESKFAVKLKDSPNSKKQFINTLASALVIGVILVATTIVYHLLISNNASGTLLAGINFLWLFLIPFFIGMGYLIISVILKILFSS